MKQGIEYEKEVIRVMVEGYCKAHHQANGAVCDACAALIDYTHRRLDKCPFGDKKSSCRKCPIHCYALLQREQARQVMRFSGPRMMLSHPIMALRHLLKEI